MCINVQTLTHKLYLLSILLTLQRGSFVSQHCGVMLSVIRKCLANLTRLLKWFGIFNRPLKGMVENWNVCTVTQRVLCRRTLRVLCTSASVFGSFWYKKSVYNIHVCLKLCMWGFVCTLCLHMYIGWGRLRPMLTPFLSVFLVNWWAQSVLSDPWTAAALWCEQTRPDLGQRRSSGPWSKLVELTDG